MTLTQQQHIDLSATYGAHNYHPLDVVISKGEAEWLWDIQGRKYLDMLSAYSAVSHGHCHPKMLETLYKQASNITMTSRAFHHDQMAQWLQKVTQICGMEKALPMNTGAEAVETAIKIARKWGYCSKNIPRHKAHIIVCDHNFHGRTTTIVGFSSEKQYKDDFGPYCNGFTSVPYGDAEALEKAITPNTVGFLFEPIQGEAGILMPPDGYLKKVSDICHQHNILCMVDEIQTGLGRTGKLFAYQYEDCKPDLVILGKALGGAFYPMSAVVGHSETLGLLKPGDHGSTFGGNPLACALSSTAIDILMNENLIENAYKKGKIFRESLSASLPKHIVKEVRGKGLLNAIELQPDVADGHHYVLELMKEGVLAKETHSVVVRFAPPLVISDESLEFAIEKIQKVFSK